ncbi:MAG: hypothetical protein II837_07895 [Treponema sp.]|nr:hypothetical protein [Treponema sp.]
MLCQDELSLFVLVPFGVKASVSVSTQVPSVFCCANAPATENNTITMARAMTFKLDFSIRNPP